MDLPQNSIARQWTTALSFDQTSEFWLQELLQHTEVPHIKPRLTSAGINIGQLSVTEGQ